jgi:hypothetical protein
MYPKLGAIGTQTMPKLGTKMGSQDGNTGVSPRGLDLHLPVPCITGAIFFMNQASSE